MERRGKKGRYLERKKKERSKDAQIRRNKERKKSILKLNGKRKKRREEKTSEQNRTEQNRREERRGDVCRRRGRIESRREGAREENIGGCDE